MLKRDVNNVIRLLKTMGLEDLRFPQTLMWEGVCWSGGGTCLQEDRSQQAACHQDSDRVHDGREHADRAVCTAFYFQWKHASVQAQGQT